MWAKKSPAKTAGQCDRVNAIECYKVKALVGVDFFQSAWHSRRSAPERWLTASLAQFICRAPWAGILVLRDIQPHTHHKSLFLGRKSEKC